MTDDWSWAERASPADLEALLGRDPGVAERRDAQGRTLLHVFAGNPRSLDMLALLLDRPGAAVDPLMNDGTSPLYRAALASNGRAVALLLGRVADVNNRNDDNRWSVLMVAAARHAPEIVSALLDREDIDVNARDDLGATALHIAAQLGHERVTALLAADPRTDPNVKDGIGRTPLIVAAFGGHAAIVTQLLARPGVEVNLVDRDRQTALHWAALERHGDVVRLLLADPRTNAGITNRPDGKTALGVAGDGAVAALLAERLATDPGDDALTPGDAYAPRPESARFFAEAPVPHPPRRRGRS